MSTPTRRYVGLIFFATLVVTQGLGPHAQAAGTESGTQSPLDLVRASVMRVQGIVRSEASLGSESERVELRRVAETLFDFEGMSRRMLARHWNAGSPPQQTEFVRLLTNLLERTYIDVIVNEAGASTTFDGESIDGVYAQVKSRVVPDRGPDVSIEYRLSKSGERWAVYDVLHEGASLVSNYRSQFGAILRTSSFGRLLERMRRNDAPVRVAAENSEDLGRRLMLFSVVAERGAR
jgi:phospholipid transport system substrate-binding protein